MSFQHGSRIAAILTDTTFDMLDNFTLESVSAELTRMFTNGVGVKLMFVLLKKPHRRD
jgi:hypothetical protein